jgi:Flavodoxin-like fold
VQFPATPLLVQVLLEVEQLRPEDRERRAGLQRLDVAGVAVLDRVVDLSRLLAVNVDRAEAVLGLVTHGLESVTVRIADERRVVAKSVPRAEAGALHRSPRAGILTPFGPTGRQLFHSITHPNPMERMMNILQINSSARRDASHSTRLATRLVQRLRDADPESTLTVRDLNAVPHPVLDEAALGALFTPADQRARPNRLQAWRSTTH